MKLLPQMQAQAVPDSESAVLRPRLGRLSEGFGLGVADLNRLQPIEP